MGVKQFFKLLAARPITVDDIENERIAVDCMTEIYRAHLGMSSALTDSNGVSTSHINVILMMARKFQRSGIEQIYVFDSPVCVPEKKRTLSDRPQHIANEQIGDMIDDVQTILTMLGISWMVSPEGFDAEHLCAELNRTGRVDHVLTTDADAFMYGADSVIKHEKVGKKSVLMHYTVEDFMSANDLTLADLRKIGAILGTDFCAKTPRVGVKTVVKKFRSVELSDCQHAAVDVFTRQIRVPTVAKNVANLDGLLLWLVDRGFSHDRMQKLLSG